MFQKSPLLVLTTLTLAITGCSQDVRTVDDVLRATGDRFGKARLWQASVEVRLNRPTHISEWEGVIYSDGNRYAAIVNGASSAGQLQSHLVIDAKGDGWLRLTEAGAVRVLKFDPRRTATRAVAPESFVLPGNPSTGNPLGMFLDPARALRTLNACYDLRLTRRTQVQGQPVLGFTGTIKPGALETIDPDRFLAHNNLPIDNIDVTVRLYDGAPRRIQFMDQGQSYFLIDYGDIDTSPDFIETRFEFDPNGADVRDLTQSPATTVAGVNDHHVLFEWDETRRVSPPTD